MPRRTQVTSISDTDNPMQQATLTGSSHGSDEDSGRRSTKRTRLSGQLSGPKTRGPTACSNCRERKTRCDNARPCGYCSKHQLQCVYSEDSFTAPWDEVGDRVLHAISQLSNLVKNQQCASCSHTIDPTAYPSSHATALHSLPSYTAHYQDVGFEPHRNETHAVGELLEEFPLKAQGTDSVLTWPIFEGMRSTDCLFADVTSSIVMSESIPDMSRSRLVHLANRYIDGVHIKNPILKLSELDVHIAHVAENGLDWSVKTCLVTLVCAIGAISQKYRDQHLSPTGQSVPGAPYFSMDSDSDPQLSLQFWTLAVKRLGLALGGNDIEAVQCLCLAGIYQMYHLQPLQAWKFFTSAGAAWTAIMLSRSQSHERLLYNGDSRSFNTMQSLCFTIWKSECELKLELEVSGPILDTAKFPHAFPSPPTPDESSPAHEIAEGERIWYYYLAEIAARHLINSIIRATAIDQWPPTAMQIRTIVRRAEVLESQVLEWHSSLPGLFAFELPTGFTAAADPDDLTQILRHRYLTCRELISRPFVRMCLETSLDFDQVLRSRIEQFASDNVRFCMLKVSQVAPHIHQGIWYGIRNLATAVLILSAVHMAKQCSWLTGVQSIILPLDWRENSLAAIDCFSPFWTMKAGGVSNIYSVLQAVLSATEPA